MGIHARGPLVFGDNPEWVDDPQARQETEDRLKYLLALLIPMMGARFRVLIDGNTIYEPDPAMDAYISELVTTQIDLINDTTKNRVQAAIAKILDEAEGKSVEELTPILEQEIGKILIDAVRADAIAGDISVGIFGWTALDVAKQAGVKSMMWMTQLDANVRFTHAAMQGQTRAPGELFESPGGGTAEYPGGFNDPAEDCNCRCLLWPLPDLGLKSAADQRYEKLNAIRLIAEHRIKPLFQGMFQMQKAAFLGSIRTGRMVSVLNLDAASLNIPDTPGHPNKMPFSGILTRVGVPSDGPPEGSGGKRVVISHDCAVKALPTLLGMAIDYVPDLDGHDPTRKIGIIEEANLVGDAISISGFIYAADFPQVAAEVKARKNELGFSYEASQVWAQDADADPLVVVDCIFTGAALLLKKKAAYQTTSFSAKSATDAVQEIDMTPEEVKKMVSDSLAEALPGALSAAVATLRADGDMDAAKMVRKHSAAIRKCAADMEASGIGKHPTKGHANLLRCAADDMDAQAASGSIPHTVGALPGYFDADEDVDASRHRARRHKAKQKADDDVDADDEDADDADMDADDDGDQDADDDGDQDARRSKAGRKAKNLAAQNKALKRQIKNLQSGAAREPERKTISPSVMSLLARTTLTPELDKGNVLSVSSVDAALKASGLTPEQRIQAKVALERAGRMA